MKKAKLPLAGVVIFAIAGGAFAFQAKKNYGSGNIFTIEVNGTCTGLDTLALEDESETQTIIGSTIDGGECTTLHFGSVR